jgi:hypothetical protein
MQIPGSKDKAAGGRALKTRFWGFGPALVLLGLIALLQLTLLGRDAFREIPRVISDLGQPAIWRSAKYSQGRRFAQYIQFLDRKIPMEMRVALPPDGVGPRAISTTPMMQFFLLPRRVINCTNPKCLASLSLENTAVLVVGGFPDPDILAQGQPEMFDSDWGVLLPSESTPGNPYPNQGYRRAIEMLGDLFLAFAWLNALALAGFLFVRQALPPSWGAGRWALGYGLGLAMLSFALALASLIGIPLSSETVLALTVLLLIAGWIEMVIRNRRAGRTTRLREAFKTSRVSFRPHLWTIAFLALAGLAAFLAIGKGYHATDELVLWGIKGYGIAADGTIQWVTQWGTNTVAYPLHIPLSIAASRWLLSEALPAAKLIFPAYAFALSLLLYEVLRQFGLRQSLAGLAALAAITAPLIFRHATMAYANLPLSFYLLAAVALLTQALASNGMRPAPGIMLLSGGMFAAAAWTRPEGLALAWVMIVVVGIAGRIRRALPGWRSLGLLIAPLLAYSAFWLWLKSFAYARPLGRSGLTEAAVEQIMSGNFHVSEALYIGRSMWTGLFDLQTWGGFGFLALLAFLAPMIYLMSHRLRAPKDQRSPAEKTAPFAGFLMALCGWAYLLAIGGIYYLTSYDSVHDISWWVSTGLVRMLMPGLLLCWVGGIAIWNSLSAPQAGALNPHSSVEPHTS